MTKKLSFKNVTGVGLKLTFDTVSTYVYTREDKTLQEMTRFDIFSKYNVNSTAIFFK